MKRTLRLAARPGRYAVCRLPPGATPPPVPERAELWSMTRTADELSLVVPESAVPAAAESERGWAALRVEGPLAFEEVGILAGLAGVLAEAGISLFALSTHDTDWLLVRAERLEAAADALRAAGHEVEHAAAWSQDRIEAHVAGFEGRTLTREEWSPDASHLVATAWYCRRLTVDDALTRMRRGIRALNAAIGVEPSAYHETVTRFYVERVHETVVGLDEGWSDARVAAVVLKRLGGDREARLALWRRYYAKPEAVLASEAARTGWVPPDRVEPEGEPG